MSAINPTPTEPSTTGGRDRVEIEHLLEAELAPDLIVQRRLGDETFGTLYLAREEGLRREVVVKVLRDHYATSGEARLRFEREARAAANIAHPNVVPVFRVGTLSVGVPFLVEPYLGECTLSGRLSALGAFDPQRVRRIMLEVASALSAAHDKGIVHRDVRPETVRCQEHSERVLLTDFGLAGILESARVDEENITASGTIIGSIGYMSPEQRKGDATTDRTDVYALGILGWRLLVGSEGHVPEPDLRTGRAVQDLGARTGDPGLSDLIRRCVSEQPGDRPSAIDVVHELSAPDRPRLPPAGDPISNLIERRIPHVVGLYLVTVVALLGVTSDLADLRIRPLLLLVTFAIAGFLATLVLAWFHGKKGRQSVDRLERWLLGGIAAAWVVTSLIVWILTGT